MTGEVLKLPESRYRSAWIPCFMSFDLDVPKVLGEPDLGCDAKLAKQALRDPGPHAKPMISVSCRGEKVNSPYILKRADAISLSSRRSGLLTISSGICINRCHNLT
jgi:hypothetical protein